MMSDTTTWLILAVFYAPVHFLGPALIGFLTGQETSAERRHLVKSVMLDCTISMLVAFAAAIWLARTHLQLAMLVLFLAMFAPYTHIWLYRRRRHAPWSTGDSD